MKLLYPHCKTFGDLGLEVLGRPAQIWGNVPLGCFWQHASSWGLGAFPGPVNHNQDIPRLLPAADCTCCFQRAVKDSAGQLLPLHAMRSSLLRFVFVLHWHYWSLEYQVTDCCPSLKVSGKSTQALSRSPRQLRRLLRVGDRSHLPADHASKKL